MDEMRIDPPPPWTDDLIVMIPFGGVVLVALAVVLIPWLKQERDLWKSWRRLK